MSYLFVKDFIYTIKNNALILKYIIIISIFLILYNIAGETTVDSTLIDDILGNKLTFLQRIDETEWTFYLLSLSLFLSIYLKLIFNDLKNGLENIFLRIKPLKWILNKLFIIFIINTFLNILLFGLSSMFNYQITIIFVKKLFFIFSIQMLITLLLFSFKEKKLTFVLFLLLTTIYFIFNHNVVTFNIYVNIISCVVILLLLICHFKKIVITDIGGI